MNKNMKEKFDKFEKRKARRPFGDNTRHLDATHMRFIDRASYEEVEAEYALIQQKKSRLSAKERDIITKIFEE